MSKAKGQTRLDPPVPRVPSIGTHDRYRTEYLCVASCARAIRHKPPLLDIKHVYIERFHILKLKDGCSLPEAPLLAKMDNRCLNKVAAGASVGGALGASIGMSCLPKCIENFRSDTPDHFRGNLDSLKLRGSSLSLGHCSLVISGRRTVGY